jgi:hypothetical protein
MDDVPTVTGDTHGHPRHPRRPRVGVQSIERAFAVLELVAASGGSMTLSSLARGSGLPPATLHRLAATLVDLGYLRQESSRRYALGPRLALLADDSRTRLSTAALPHLSRLVDATGETAGTPRTRSPTPTSCWRSWSACGGAATPWTRASRRSG